MHLRLIFFFNAPSPPLFILHLYPLFSLPHTYPIHALKFTARAIELNFFRKFFDRLLLLKSSTSSRTLAGI